MILQVNTVLRGEGMETITCVGVLGWHPSEPLDIKKASSLMWEAGHEKLPPCGSLIRKDVTIFVFALTLIDPTSMLHNQCFSDLQTKSIEKHIFVSTRRDVLSGTVSRNWHPNFLLDHRGAPFKNAVSPLLTDG